MRVGRWVLLLFLLESLPVGAADLVIFDDFHAQTFGNADWTVVGAYSDMAETLWDHGFQPVALSWVSRELQFTPEVLRRAKVVVLPEPNRPYTSAELRTLEEFIRAGGGLFLIADHGGSDRDFDGWDSAMILDELGPRLGVQFLGDTFSETPVAGRYSPSHMVTAGVSRIGAWAATSLEILPEAVGRLEAVIACADGRPFVVAGSVGRGRLVALGDSSPFDDGTGLPDKNLHASYQSWLYDHPQLALNAVAYCAGRDSAPRIDRGELNLAESAPLDQADRPRRMYLDCGHGNAGVETLNLLRAQLGQELQQEIFLGFQPYRREVLERFGLALVVNLSQELTPEELEAMAGWVRAGGRLLLASSGARAPQNGITQGNRLLERMGSGIRLNFDEVLDRESNAGKRWAVVARTFTEHWPSRPLPSGVIAWRCGSLIDPAGALLESAGPVRVLYRTEPTGWCKPHERDGQQGIQLERPASYPLGAVEEIGQGRIAVVSVVHLGDFQYPDWDRYPDSYREIRHETPRVNRELVELLLAGPAPR